MLCAEHGRQAEGDSVSDNQLEGMSERRARAHSEPAGKAACIPIVMLSASLDITSWVKPSRAGHQEAWNQGLNLVYLVTNGLLDRN